MLANIALSALAFGGPTALRAPARSASSTVKMTFSDELGAQAPLGFFDPLGFLKDADEARFDRLRSVELKHGRVCMLAVLGHIVTTAGARLPGNINYEGLAFADIPAGLKALEVVPLAGIAQIVVFIGLLEIFVMKDVAGTGEFPGDFRNNYIDFGWDTFDDETKLKKRAIELNNGRAAQMGILALFVHEKLDNNPYIINSLLGFPVPFNQ